LIDQRRLLFWQKMIIRDNVIFTILLLMITSRSLLLVVRMALQLGQ